MRFSVFVMYYKFWGTQDLELWKECDEGERKCQLFNSQTELFIYLLYKYGSYKVNKVFGFCYVL